MIIMTMMVMYVTPEGFIAMLNNLILMLMIMRISVVQDFMVSIKIMKISAIFVITLAKTEELHAISLI